MFSFCKKSPKLPGGLEPRKFIQVNFDDVNNRLNHIKQLIDDDFVEQKNYRFHSHSLISYLDKMLDEIYIPFKTAMDNQELRVSKKELYTLNSIKLKIVSDCVQRNIDHIRSKTDFFSTSELKKWQDFSIQVNTAIALHESKNQPMKCVIL